VAKEPETNQPGQRAGERPETGLDTGAERQPEVAAAARGDGGGAIQSPAGSGLEPVPSSEEASEPLADPLSAMSPRFNLFFRWYARRFFGDFVLDPQVVDLLKQLERRGSVVYVMRYASRLDYFLFNFLFTRHGLRLSRFGNGLRFYYYRPLHRALAVALRRRRGRPAEIEHSEDQEYARELVRRGESLFLFLRTARFRNFVRSRRSARRRDELDLVREVVATAWDGEQQVHVVPLAIFWRKGPRSKSRFLNLTYGASSRPSDLAKVGSFLANYRSLSVKVGEPVDLRRLVDENRAQGVDRLTRKVRRSILMWLFREEKVVEGPVLRSREKVMSEVLADPGVREAIRARQQEGRGRSADRAWRDAEKIFYEIAANMNSTFLGLWRIVLDRVFARMFGSVETQGLSRVAEHAARHPIVLVPSHRSYFDFLILSWLFYKNFLVPPHIAARDNMAFGPFGALFRLAGAFFLRGSFDDPLYKEVFRTYVGYLVRKGFTQEFFIEGGRSRTGKTLAPRLGMLAWNVDAFVESSRQDLFIVPIAITYERLVEEGSMVDELAGGEKQKESVAGLVRARKLLRNRFGSVHVNFGEPISLAERLGEQRDAWRGRGDEVSEPKRLFVERLGRDIVERINWHVTANATSVVASVLLGSPSRGLLRTTLVERMHQVVDLLRLQQVRLTPALAADSTDFRESIAFLQRADLVATREDPRGEIVYFEESRRRALDIYRNSIFHFLAAPSFLARGLLRGGTPKDLAEDVAFWEELLDQEIFHRRDAGEGGAGRHAVQCQQILDHFERCGWAEAASGAEDPGFWVATPRGRRMLAALETQTRGTLEAYQATCFAAEEALPGEDARVPRKELRALAGERFAGAQLLGEASRPEGSNETTYQNALDLLVRRGVLAAERPPRRRGRRGSGDPVYRRGERWDLLSELGERLATALAGR